MVNNQSKVEPSRLEKGLWWSRALYATHGCRPRSEACEHCWAARAAHMRAGNPNIDIAEMNAGITERGHFIGRVNLDAGALKKPWKIHRPKVWAIWDDLFYGDEEDEAWCKEHGVPFEPVPFSFAARVLEVVFGTVWHTYILLTKRPKRMAEFFSKYAVDYDGDEPLVSYAPGARYLCAPDQWPLSNLVLGTTVETQEHIGRLDDLFQSPAHRYTVSLEPLLGEVYLGEYLEKLDGVQAGGETGHGARPLHPGWIRSVRNECLQSGTDFFFKGWGEYLPAQIMPDLGIYYSCASGFLCAFKYDEARDHMWNDQNGTVSFRLGRKHTGRKLDGYIHDALPW